MSNLLKCPNPSCPYTFDSSQVPVGVVLSCPRCSMRFTLGPPPPPASEPPPISSESVSAGAPPTGPAEREESRRKPRRDREEPAAGMPAYQIAIFALMMAALIAGAVLVIGFKVISRRTSRGGEAVVVKDTDGNLGVEGLPKGWAQDDGIRLKVSAPFGYGFKRESPEGYVVLGRTEYAKGRAPRGTEMRRDLEAPFRKLFTRHEEEPPLDNAWLGLPVGPRHGFKFRAPSGDGLIWQGEAYTVAHQGIAYFWLGWCGEGDFDKLQPEFTEFRSRCKLLGLRDDWRETVAREIAYKGATVPYTFTDTEDAWKEVPVDAEKKEQPELDRGLRINYTPRRERNATPDVAELRVYLLDGAGDPLQRAREYVQNVWTNHLKSANDQLPAPTFTERTGDPEGDPLTKGGTSIVRLESAVLDPGTKKVIASSESRLIVFSAVRVGDKIVVLHCWCEAARRSVFEWRFVQIASSLR